MARSIHEQRQYVIDQYPQMWQGFQAMREAIKTAGPLDFKTQELINTAIYATVGAEGGTKTHAVRAHEAGASVEELNQALLLGLGVGMGYSPVYRAIEWVREALTEAGVKA